MIQLSLPQDRAFLVDGKGLTTPPFYKWMANGTAAIRQLQADVLALQEAIAGEDGEPVAAVVYSVVQGAGIRVTGAGTQESPWVIALRPLDNSGTGTGLYKIAVDAYGRVSGYEPAGGEDIAEPVNALTVSSGVVNIDCALGDYFTLAPTANVTSITFSNLPATGKAQTVMIQFTQDTTPRTVAWPASFKWESGIAGAVSTGSGAVDVLALTTFNQGTTWIATLAKAFA